MNRQPLSTRQSKRGSALLISLTMIVLITVVILAFVVQTKLERQLSAIHWDDQQAQNIAQLGFDNALTLIRKTLEPYDNPFGATNPPTTFWSLSPGRIDVFALTSGQERPQRVVDGVVELHSGFPVADPDDAADLNAPDGMGNLPIWPQNPDIDNQRMEVDWILVGRNPNEPLSDENPIVGRYAFWVDDEGSKINVNTADGSDNYTLSSYGQGTPTAVSLSVFRELEPTNTHAPDRDTVRLLAAEARRKSFDTVSEVATRSSLTNAVGSNFIGSNLFNLTTFSRSPDFNIFNLPKFQLIPSNVAGYTGTSSLAGDSAGTFIAANRLIQYPAFNNFWFYTAGTNAAQSGIRSLYPTPSQLSGAWTNHSTPSYANQPVWPLMPSYARPSGSSGYMLVANTAKRNDAGGTFTVDSGPRFNAMLQIESYLLGTNALGQPIEWPFQYSNYLQKYNLRQLDSITLQIFEMPRSADFGVGLNGEELMLAAIAPYGIMGTNAVMSAVGRHPRLARMQAIAHLRNPTVNPLIRNPTNVVGNTPVYEKDTNGQEIWYKNSKEFRLGLTFSAYLPRHLYDSDTYVDNTLINQAQQVFVGWGNAGLNEADWQYGAGTMLNPASTNHWMDNQLYAEAYDTNTASFSPGNSSGIDFRGNSAYHRDPDARAPIYRMNSYNPSIGIIQVYGTGFNTWQTNAIMPLLSYNVFGPNANMPALGPGLFQNFSQNFTDGAASQARSSSPNLGLFRYPTRNRGPEIDRIRLRGGITARFRMVNGNTTGVYPIENLVGPMGGGTVNPLGVANRISLTNSAGVEAWRQGVTNRMIPLFERFVEAGVSKQGGLELALGQTKYIVAKARDPLVSQLAGDWVIKVYNSLPGTNITGNPQIFNSWPGHEYNWATTGFPGNPAFDFRPEPEWVDMAADTSSVNFLSGNVPDTAPNGELQLPYLENGIQKIQRVNSGGLERTRVLNVSRQKTFPSVGHLQYIRTGAMPDNENALVGDTNHAGMPFRCLNFGPKNTQGGIPDWALLDLFMLPNAIWSKPSSRFAYPAISTNQPNRPELIHLTFGGASSGKINLNGSVLWPWAETDTNFIRPMPLAAQFNGLRYNQDGKVTRNYLPAPGVNWNVSRVATVTTPATSWNVLNAPAASSLAEAVAAYIRTNKPLAMPGQICDIPAVNGYGATITNAHPVTGESLLHSGHGTRFYGPTIPNPESPVINRTRNDIVSQSIGNLVTQGNVFSVWVTGESIRKSKTSDPTRFDSETDHVVGRSRLRFLVERKLDPGVDGIYGNSKPKIGAANPGPAGWDNIIGTPDDQVDPVYHPANPKFIYQVRNVQIIP